MSKVLAVLALLAALAGAPLVMTLAFAAALPIPTAPTVSGDGGAGSGQGGAQVAAVLAWADSHVGDSYFMGANGPDAWDCSSFTQAAYAQIGVRLPRTAQQQRDWLASGHGQPVPPGQEQPGDLIFWDSYLGPHAIGHVVIINDPSRRRTTEAHNTRSGVGHFTYHPNHRWYEIWRPTTPGDTP